MSRWARITFGWCSIRSTTTRCWRPRPTTPGRDARRWRAEGALEGAVYAETIPFNETRQYVKNVMNNAAYYKALFEGRPQSLKSLLGVVPPRRAVNAEDAARP